MAQHTAAHPRRHRLLTLLLPLLVATEFIESGGFLFAAGQVMQGLGAGPQAFAALLAAYAAGSMVMIGLQQALTRRFGYRRYLTASLLLFIAGGLGSLLAGSLGQLVVARTVQGLGSGALFTSGRILVVLLFNRQDRPAALRRFIAVLFGLSAWGPAAAAVLVHRWGWQAVFALPLPLALLGLAGAWTLLPDTVGRSDTPVRWSATGVLLLVAAAGLLQFGLSAARSAPPSDSKALVALWLLAGSIALLAFNWAQRRHPHPLAHGHHLRQPVYSTGLALFTLYYLVASASTYWVPVLAEHRLGLPLPQIGLLASAGAVASWLAALAYLRWGARLPAKRPLLALSAGLMALASAGLAWLPAGASWLALLPPLLAKGVFTAFFVLPLAGLTFRDLADEQFGAGYQRKNLLRHLAVPLGSALAALLMRDNLALPGWVLAGASLLLLALVLAQRQLR